MTLTREALKGFAKVDTRVAGGFVKVILFNRTTGATMEITVDDLEYQKDIQYYYAEQVGCSIQELEQLRYMPCNTEAQKAYQHHLGIIHIGDTVEVFKGRKVAKGTVSKVVNIYDYKDQYGRTQTTYVVLEDGQKTNINNCRLV